MVALNYFRLYQTFYRKILAQSKQMHVIHATGSENMLAIVKLKDEIVSNKIFELFFLKTNQKLDLTEWSRKKIDRHILNVCTTNNFLMVAGTDSMVFLDLKTFEDKVISDKTSHSCVTNHDNILEYLMESESHSLHGKSELMEITSTNIKYYTVESSFPVDPFYRAVPGFSLQNTWLYFVDEDYDIQDVSELVKVNYLNGEIIKQSIKASPKLIPENDILKYLNIYTDTHRSVETPINNQILIVHSSLSTVFNITIPYLNLITVDLYRESPNGTIEFRRTLGTYYKLLHFYMPYRSEYVFGTQIRPINSKNCKTKLYTRDFLFTYSYDENGDIAFDQKERLPAPALYMYCDENTNEMVMYSYDGEYRKKIR
jgi:hypothetical protein